MANIAGSGMSIWYWRQHPGRNPAHKFGEGRARWQQKIPDLRFPPSPFSSATLMPTVEVTMLGPKIVNRWLPHQGKHEKARRLARIMTMSMAAE